MDLNVRLGMMELSLNHSALWGAVFLRVYCDTTASRGYVRWGRAKGLFRITHIRTITINP